MDTTEMTQERATRLLAGIRDRAARAEQRGQAGWKFASNEALVLTLGRGMGPARGVSLEQRGKRGECYVNSRRLARTRKSFSYCEGFALAPGGNEIYDHAWVLSAEGEVVDPTRPDAALATYFGVVIPKVLMEEVYGEFRLEDGVLRSDSLYQYRLKKFGEQLLGRGGPGKGLGD